jgi:superfamily I DNA and/or RNA helicase
LWYWGQRRQDGDVEEKIVRKREMMMKMHREKRKGREGVEGTLVEWRDVSEVSNIVCHSCLSRHRERSSSLKRSKGF